LPFNARSSSLTAAQPGRQDSYLLSSYIADDDSPTTESIGHDVRTYNLATGSATIMEDSAVNNDAQFLRGDTIPQVTTNTTGDTLAVWDHVDNCNTLTINSLKVVVAGADHGTSGIEPFLVLQTSSQQPGEQIWYWTDGTGGGNDVTSGAQYGPN